MGRHHILVFWMISHEAKKMTFGGRVEKCVGLIY